MKTDKIFFNWSSGKDSSMALHKLIQQGRKPDLLMTTINKENQRIGMHGLKRELLERQAKAIGIPLKVIELPESLDHGAYDQLMTETCDSLKAEGFNKAIFGDIYLQDLRDYREKQLNAVGLEVEFPLWKMDTKELIHEFVNLGFRACIVSASKKYFDIDFVGSEIDTTFLDRLHSEVDPCGENGEFHSFCFEGPIFEERVPFERGEKIVKTYPQPNRKDEDEEVAFHFIELH